MWKMGVFGRILEYTIKILSEAVALRIWSGMNCLVIGLVGKLLQIP
jgi:hypothetical protein